MSGDSRYSDYRRSQAAQRLPGRVMAPAGQRRRGRTGVQAP
ncbi:hypothetical protein ACFPM0_19270 [Pseudonocardia sulfidoxydans]